MKYETIKKKIAPAVGAVMIATGSLIGPKAIAEEVEKAKVEAVQEVKVEKQEAKYLDIADIMDSYMSKVEGIGQKYEKQSAELFDKADKEEITDKQYETGLEKLSVEFEKELKNEEVEFEKQCEAYTEQIEEYTQQVVEITEELKKDKEDMEKQFNRAVKQLDEVIESSLDLIRKTYENSSNKDDEFEKSIQEYLK